MIGKPFKYTLNTPIGQKEILIENLGDLYHALSDRMDYEVYKLEKKIEDKTKKSMLLACVYSLVVYTVISFGVTIMVLLCG